MAIFNIFFEHFQKMDLSLSVTDWNHLYILDFNVDYINIEGLVYSLPRGHFLSCYATAPRA